jgi:hypothetical protein
MFAIVVRDSERVGSDVGKTGVLSKMVRPSEL